MANLRRRINLITKVYIGKAFKENLDEVKEEIARFFEQLYTSEGFHRPTLDRLLFPSISLHEKVWMETEFEEKEINLSLGACAEDKGQGPYGFNFIFLRAA